MKSNVGKSTCHVSCLYSEGKAIKPTDLKLVAKYPFLLAPSNLTNQLAGFGRDSRTGSQITQIPRSHDGDKKTIGLARFLTKHSVTVC